ncbi:MAG TPA: ATP F0F1 synthase subunit B [Caulobacteraceae bacterium]|jgi:F-type H+-transporting ATPase subunit b|nr:ATP F0F1 synthase subunit B [Caulobacteraceae bacterium]
MDIMKLLQDAEFWVGAAFVLFIALLIWVGVPKALGGMLDARAQKVRDQLAEAERLRREAEQLLASITKEREAAEKTAADIIANAKEQAKRLKAQAKIQLEEQIKRRAEMAERKIAQAEAQAAAEVKAAAADLATELAERVLTTRLATTGSDPLVDRAIKDLPAKLS